MIHIATLMYNTSHVLTLLGANWYECVCIVHFSFLCLIQRRRVASQWYAAAPALPTSDLMHPQCMYHLLATCYDVTPFAILANHSEIDCMCHLPSAIQRGEGFIHTATLPSNRLYITIDQLNNRLCN